MGKQTSGPIVSELDGLTIVTSAARTISGDSGDQLLSSVLEAGAAISAFGVLIDITVQGGTQASIDFDLQFKIAGSYTRVARYNSVPADGLVAQLLVPQTGAKPLPIGDARWLSVPDAFRLAWTFNTPGVTPTITFAALAVGWGFRNSRAIYPSTRY